MVELTIKAEVYTHLVKALRPLPEKFHGLAGCRGAFPEDVMLI